MFSDATHQTIDQPAKRMINTWIITGSNKRSRFVFLQKSLIKVRIFIRMAVDMFCKVSIKAF